MRPKLGIFTNENLWDAFRAYYPISVHFDGSLGDMALALAWLDHKLYDYQWGRTGVIYFRNQEDATLFKMELWRVELNVPPIKPEDFKFEIDRR